MSDIGFAPKKIIPQEVCQLEILAADKADTYGPQVALKLKVVSGEHDGHTFTDYASRDEDTGQINEGSKAWSVFESCLGRDFYKQPSVSLDSRVGASGLWLESRRRAPGAAISSSSGLWVPCRWRGTEPPCLTATTPATAWISRESPLEERP